jgi:hypothetical protein
MDNELVHYSKVHHHNDIDIFLIHVPYVWQGRVKIIRNGRSEAQQGNFNLQENQPRPILPITLLHRCVFQELFLHLHTGYDVLLGWNVLQQPAIRSWWRGFASTSHHLAGCLWVPLLSFSESHDGVVREVGGSRENEELAERDTWKLARCSFDAQEGQTCLRQSVNWSLFWDQYLSGERRRDSQMPEFGHEQSVLDRK